MIKILSFVILGSLMTMRAESFRVETPAHSNQPVNAKRYIFQIHSVKSSMK